jgi:hypothetical protein
MRSNVKVLGSRSKKLFSGDTFEEKLLEIDGKLYENRIILDYIHGADGASGYETYPWLVEVPVENYDECEIEYGVGIKYLSVNDDEIRL